MKLLTTYKPFSFCLFLFQSLHVKWDLMAKNNAKHQNYDNGVKLHMHWTFEIWIYHSYNLPMLWKLIQNFKAKASRQVTWVTITRVTHLSSVLLNVSIATSASVLFWTYYIISYLPSVGTTLIRAHTYNKACPTCVTWVTQLL